MSSNNSFTSSLPFKLILALVLGILAGLGLSAIEGSAICTALLNIIVTVRYISGQFINFCVPLIMKITPSFVLGRKYSPEIMP